MRLFVLILILAGCSGPGLDFRGIAPAEMQVDGITFVVRAKATEAEAIRTNKMSRPRMSQVGEAAAIAIERLTGCEVRQISGDVAVIRATLRCRDGPNRH